VDGEDERQRAMETGCWGGQGSPRAVAPRGWRKTTIRLGFSSTFRAITHVPE
jgi:hypothetical protein